MISPMMNLLFCMTLGGSVGLYGARHGWSIWRTMLMCILLSTFKVIVFAILGIHVG